jgi:2-polyprenyl-6-methoxyphenol hydroxylase-like FAD-dependent oxidoreductase
MASGSKRAVVLGGSVAGLTAARVLSDTFDEVVVVERDPLDDTRQPRKGVPQGRHVHGIYSTGLLILESLFPGLRDDLLQSGAVEADMGSEFHWWHWGGFRLPQPAGVRALLQSRPLLEQQLRRHLRRVPRVVVKDETDVLAPVASNDGSRVVGVRVRDRRAGQFETTLTADLVVDATGRGSRAPRWMEELGFQRPPETELFVDLAFATRIYRRRPSDLAPFKALVISPAGPAERRLGVIFPIEDERWSASLAGWVGDHPPLDEEGWLKFAASLPTPEFHRVVASAEPLGTIVQHKFPSNLRRHWERLSRWPERLVVLGDAMCSFNPAYGQGMTVASFECRELGACVAQGLDGLPRRFYRRAGAIVDRAWTLAAGEDLRFPQVRGPRPFGAEYVNAYIARLHRASHKDPTVLKALLEVMSLRRPPPWLMTPGMLWRAIA